MVKISQVRIGVGSGLTSQLDSASLELETWFWIEFELIRCKGPVSIDMIRTIFCGSPCLLRREWRGFVRSPPRATTLKSWELFPKQRAHTVFPALWTGSYSLQHTVSAGEECQLLTSTVLIYWGLEWESGSMLGSLKALAGVLVSEAELGAWWWQGGGCFTLSRVNFCQATVWPRAAVYVSAGAQTLKSTEGTSQKCLQDRFGPILGLVPFLSE